MSTPTQPPVRVTHFPLEPKHLTITGVFALIIILSSSHRFVEPGSPLYDHVLARIAPSINLATVHTVQDWTFRILGGIHALEVPLFAVLKLRKHGVSLFSGLALKWLGSIFFSGKATWSLWDKAVKTEERRRV
ncbi:unnamed protein product [Discula destructiva]